MVFLHHLKKEAVLNLCNFLLPNSISELKDLADGEALQKTIDTKFPEFSKDCVYLQKQLDIESVKSNQNEDIFRRFQYIQKFIDERYNLKSEEIIAYDKCIKLCELELAKVALFVLTEIVILLTHQDSSTLQTLFHLDCSLQEELEECFRLFISEREMIKKSDIERILSKNAKNTASFITPRRSCASKYRHQDNVSSSTPAKEEVFSNSPLKSFFESPIFKKEDIMTKQKEISQLKKILEEGDQELNKQLNENKEFKKSLEEKDKYIKNLEGQLKELKHEIESTATSDCTNEFCMQERKRMKKECNELQKSVEDYQRRISWLQELDMDMCKRVNELEKATNKEKVGKKKALPQHYFKTVLEDKDLEIKRMQKALRDLADALKDKEITISKLLEKEKRSKIMSEDSMSALKIKFESSNSRENEENAGHFIDEDYRMLQVKLNKVELEKKDLLKQVENLTERVQRFENYPTEKSSNLMMSEMIDESKTLEAEKLRSSENVKEHCDLQNESLILNNSMKEHASEKSVSPVSIKMDPINGSGNDAILWKAYDSQSESEKMNDVKLDPELHIKENTDRDCIVIDDILNVPENKYIVEDFNLNSIINSIKILSANGSFQKVLQVINDLQDELKLKKTSSEAEKAIKLYFQKILNIIAEFMISECSRISLKNKKGLSKENCCETEQEIIEKDPPKFETTEMIEKYEVQLRKKQEDIESLRKSNENLMAQNKAILWRFKSKKKEMYLLMGQFEELQKKFDDKSKKYSSCRQITEKLKETIRKKDEDITILKSKILEQLRSSKEYHKIIQHYKKEKKNLNETVQKLSLELTKRAAMEVKTNSSETEVPAVSIKINCITENKVLDPVITESHCSILQDIGNESMLSSALCNKTLASFQFVSHNEEDFLNHSSLADIKKDYEDDRFEELKRRNSQLPLHLQSSYPIETNFLSNENLYVKNSEKEKYKVCYDRCTDGNESSSKRQKLTDVEPEVQPSSMTATPITRMRKTFKTPTSLKKLLHLSRTRRFQSIKPKP